MLYQPVSEVLVPIILIHPFCKLCCKILICFVFRPHGIYPLSKSCGIRIIRHGRAKEDLPYLFIYLSLIIWGKLCSYKYIYLFCIILYSK